MPEFENRVVVISGATGGAGQPITDRFLNEGATVFALGRSRKNEHAPARLVRVEADLFTREGARSVVKTAISRAGRIDVLVHLVGGFAGGQSVAEAGAATWEHMMNINFHAALFMFEAVIPEMMKRRHGRIIAMGSRAGVDPVATLGPYSVSKAALHALVRAIAADVKDFGITSNAVLPGVIDTAANRRGNPAADHTMWVTPESIAELILWLASDRAGDVNGALIPIYGRS